MRVSLYLWILQKSIFRWNYKSHLKTFRHDFACICTGAGAVLRVFDEDKDEAIYKINQMYPEQVYRVLTTVHPHHHKQATTC